MRLRLERYWKKIKDFLLSPRSKEFLVFLFFFFVSASFWVLQALNDTFDMEVTVPLQLRGVPKNVMVTTELPSEVKVTISNRGTSLIHYFRRRVLPPVALEFNRYDNGSTSARVQIPTADVQRVVQSQLGGSKVQGIRPDTLVFYYNRGLFRRLPVRVMGSIAASPQNYMIGVFCEPDSVDVYAPSSILDTLQAAYTQPVDLTDLTRSVEQEITLNAKPGMKYMPPSVKLTAEVDYFTEKTVEVPIIGLNFPADKQLRTFPSKAKITFRVGAASFKRITQDSFVLAITYEELLQNGPEKYRLHLKSIPDGVSNIRIIPAEVDYLIEQVEDGEE